MAQVNLVNKQVKMEQDQIIRFQIITHCYLNHLTLSDLDIDCLVELGKSGEYELTEFCLNIAEQRSIRKLKEWKPNPQFPKDKGPTSSPQTIRNSLIKLEKGNLIYKQGKGRKKIALNPGLKIQTSGNILLNYKFIYAESKKE